MYHPGFTSLFQGRVVFIAITKGYTASWAALHHGCREVSELILEELQESGF